MRHDAAVSSLPAQLSGSVARSAAYVGAAAVFAAVGCLVAGTPDASLVPVAAVLALLTGVAVVLAAVRSGAMTSPLIVLCMPLLVSLPAALQPITRIFGEWHLGTLIDALLIVVAPLAGVGASMLLAPGPTPQLQRGTSAAPRSVLLVAVCLLMCVGGTAAYIYEWSSIGGPPLLSANIDEARYALDVGFIHGFTQGLPLALMIAAWARVAHPKAFTWLQRRTLEVIVGFVPCVVILGGGRSLLLIPMATVYVVVARYVTPRAVRLMMIVVPVTLLFFSTAFLIVRESQHTRSPVATSILYGDSGAKSSPLESLYRSLSIGLGEQLRVVEELRDGNIRTPPFTTSLWFAHNLTGRAQDPHKITGPNAGGWLTSTYAGPLLLDFGMPAALLFGFLLGAGAQLLYRRFARGGSVTVIWTYAYLAGPLAVAFYINLFLFFLYWIVDLIALFTLSRLLIARKESPVAVAASSI